MNTDLLGISTVSVRGTSSTAVDVKIIYALAIKSNANSIIFAHNHPSGNLKASQMDVELTRKIKEAGELLGILIHDHIILGKEGYYSLADEGDI